MFKGLSKTLPGLSDFYMVGQWALATIGISTVAIAGRKLVQDLASATASASGRREPESTYPVPGT